MPAIVYLSFSNVSDTKSYPFQKENSSHVEMLYSGNSLTIGRSVGSDIYIPEKILSGIHCSLTYDGNNIVLRDEKSQNGIFLGNKKIQSLTLEERKLQEVILARHIKMSVVYTVDDYACIADGPLNREILVGKTLGNFKIDAFFQPGGSSYLYRGTNIALNKPVIVKVMKQSTSTSSNMAKRFQRVGRILCKLSHPGLPQLYHSDITLLEAGKKNFNIFYFVWEWIEGDSLLNILNHNKSMGKKMGTIEACELILQIAHIISYLHKNKIVHRNLAPSSIILDLHGQAKVVGVNLLKDLKEEEMQSWSGSATGIKMGILGYAAPEQLENVSSADYRADIFALGAIFYHCLYNQPPFPEKNLHDMLRHIKAGPSITSKDCVSEVIQKCLQYEPQQRYPNIPEFTRRLQKLFDGFDTLHENFYRILPAKSLNKNSLFFQKIDLAVLYQPLEKIGGDFYFYLEFPQEEKMILFVGDITGHGIAAGVLVGMIVASCKLIAEKAQSPKAILEELHNVIFSFLHSGTSAEMACVLLDRKQEKAIFSQAGMLPVLVWKKATEQSEILQKRGSRVGYMRKFFCEETTIDFKPGDKMLLLSDGVIEARLLDDKGNPLEDERCGLDNVIRMVQENPSLDCNALVNTIYEETKKIALIEDDTTILSVSFK